MEREDIMEIDNNAWEQLKKLIENTAPGVSITVHYYKGTQDETVDGSSYDDDWWSIEGYAMKTKPENYYVGDAYLSKKVIELAGKRILEKGLGW